MRNIDRQDWLIAMLIFALALALRLVFLWTSADRAWPHSMFYEGDAVTWVHWANALERDAPFEMNLPLRSPAVAYLLHWIAPSVSQNNIPWLKSLWCVFTSAAIAFGYLAMAMSVPRLVAMIASGFGTFAFSISVFSVSLNNEALYLLQLMAIIFLTQQIMLKQRWWLVGVLGLVHGMAMLTRPEHLLLLLMLLAFSVWTAWIRQHSLWRSIVSQSAMAAIAIAVCMPWSIRGSLELQRYNTMTEPLDFAAAEVAWTSDAQEYLLSLPAFAQLPNFRAATQVARYNGSPQVTKNLLTDLFNDFGYVPQPLPNWTFLTFRGPLDFAMANHPSSNGGFSKAAMVMPGDDSPRLLFGRPDHLRLINKGYSVGWNYITSDFGTWLKNLRRKFSHAFEGVALGMTSLNLPLGLDGQRRPIDMFTSTISNTTATMVVYYLWNGLVLVLIAIGLALCVAKRTCGLWLVVLAYKLIVIAMFYGYARQAASIAPVFYLFIAIAIYELWTRYRQSRPAGQKTKNAGRLAATIAGVVIIGLFVTVDVIGSLRRPYMDIRGSVEFSPQLGPDAFQSVGLLEMKVADPPSDDQLIAPK